VPWLAENWLSILGVVIGASVAIGVGRSQRQVKTLDYRARRRPWRGIDQTRRSRPSRTEGMAIRFLAGMDAQRQLSSVVCPKVHVSRTVICAASAPPSRTSALRVRSRDGR
jgi:hypothetical protein